MSAAEQQLDFQVRDIGFAHFRNRELLTQPKELNTSSDRRYDAEKGIANAKFWDDVLKEELRSTFIVVLNNFDLFEWFPRSPGLYYTSYAASAREEALQHIDSDFPDRTGTSRDHASGRSQSADRRRTLVFKPLANYRCWKVESDVSASSQSNFRMVSIGS
jgi:hypothetical protein